MAYLSARHSGVWKGASQVHARYNNTWRPVKNLYVMRWRLDASGHEDSYVKEWVYVGSYAPVDSTAYVPVQDIRDPA